MRGREYNPAFFFFTATVEEIVKQRGYDISEMARWYLSNLLTTYLRTDKLSFPNKKNFPERPFALTFLEAQNVKKQDSVLQLKHLGDTTLYLTGYFGKSFENSLLTVDYYRTLGILSYRRISLLTVPQMKSDTAPLFKELAQKFNNLAKILEEISETHQLNTASDIIMVYKKWLLTRSKKLEKWLRERGVLVVESKTH